MNFGSGGGWFVVGEVELRGGCGDGLTKVVVSLMTVKVHRMDR